MIYSMNDPHLLNYFTGTARINLALRVVYIKYVLPLRTQLNSASGKKSYEMVELSNKVTNELFAYGVPWSFIRPTLVSWNLL